MQALLLLITFPISLISQELLQYQVDIQGNTYEIYEQEIVKHNFASDEEFRYSSKLLGNIYQLDATNPLRPLIFYKDVQKLVITDNTLSEQNQQVVSFEDLGMFQIQCVANSRIDNGIWLYDQELLQIVKLDRTLKSVIETGNLAQLLGLENFAPSKMVEKSGYLYVYCPSNGFLIFDIYGTFYKQIPITDVYLWNKVEGQILYVKDREAYVYHLKDFVSESLNTIWPKSNKIMWIDEGYLYHSNKNKVFKTNLMELKSH